MSGAQRAGAALRRGAPGLYAYAALLYLFVYAPVIYLVIFSFNDAANRMAFLLDEDAYCRRFELDDEQRDAVRRRDVLAMIAAGGNIYYLAKLAGIFGLNVQDVGAQQTGVSVEEFRARLSAAGG